ncbi:MAG: hypothetical protein J4428_03105 [Candidatus Aenigmarchaeota archaeon]|nr:hypothetical protein [Candidatus Aenigmarchaeota archaeon]
MGEVQYLDLHKVELYGWHRSRSGNDIRRYQELIRSGSEAPPIHVCEIGPDEYTLDMYYTVNRGLDNALLDGGHRRAKAYYEERVPLPVILSNKAFAVPPERRVPISKMELVD